MRLEWPSNSVRFTNLRNEQIEFGWDGEFKVNGEGQSLKGNLSIDNPYCSAALDSTEYEIGFGEIAMRLNFG
jgi:hypothetical protein